MSKVFVISDIWFNRLLNDDPNENVADNNERSILNWNSTVNKKDKVYVLGGFGIGDLYQIIVNLNGEIHFLNNYFNEDEKEFIEQMKFSINKSSCTDLNEKIFFEDSQIVVLNDQDSVLSYFPLEDWCGKLTGTYCFHGFNDNIEINEHTISCCAKLWNYTPVNINDVQKNIKAINEIIND